VTIDWEAIRKEKELEKKAELPLWMHPVSIAIISLVNGLLTYFSIGWFWSLEVIHIILISVAGGLQFAFGLWVRYNAIKAMKRKPDEEA
jgi:uncharacterized membrane-anchored protein